MVDEVARLGLSRGIVRDGKVVGPADDPGVVGPLILVIEVGVRVIPALGSLCIREINMGRHGSPVDVSLIGADVNSGKLNRRDRR